PGQRQQARDPGLDETEAARGERDQRQETRARVREHDERRVRPGADGGETADEAEVVERRLADDAAECEGPTRAERVAQAVALSQEPLARAAGSVLAGK